MPRLPSFRNLGLGALALTLVLSCGQDDRRQNLYQQLTELRQQLDDLEGLPGSDAVADMIADSHARLDQVDDMIVEAAYEDAETAIYDIGGAVAAADAQLTGPTIPVMPPVRVTGEVLYQPAAGGPDQNYNASISPENAKGLDTGANSTVIWRLHEHIQLRVMPLTTVRIISSGSATETVSLRLLKGSIRLSTGRAQPAVNVIAGTFSFTVQNHANAEFTVTDTGDPDYLAALRGNLAWQSETENGLLSRNQALFWPAGTRSLARLSLKPRLEKPAHGEDIAITGTTGTVRFSWMSLRPEQAYQFELSEAPDFLTTLVDKRVESNMFEETLSPGTYYWRVRGYGEDFLPGAYSMSSVFTVEENEKPSAAGDTADEAGDGPPISNVKVELIGDTGIVTGRTQPGCSVRVKGAQAVMLESGNFRAVVNFLREGQQDIDIIAYDPASGLQTTVTRTVKVNY